MLLAHGKVSFSRDERSHETFITEFLSVETRNWSNQDDTAFQLKDNKLP